MQKPKLSEMFVRCKCMKKTENGLGTIERSFWGSADKAVVGNTVKIEEDNGSWTEGWKVTAVYGEPEDEKIVRKRSHDYTRQRKASDI